jgi:hypothetical protein
MANEKAEEIIRNLPELEENSDTRSTPARISDFLSDFQALTYVEECGGISTMLSETSADVLIAIVADFAGELERRINDNELEFQKEEGK